MLLLFGLMVIIQCHPDVYYSSFTPIPFAFSVTNALDISYPLLLLTNENTAYIITISDVNNPEELARASGQSFSSRSNVARNNPKTNATLFHSLSADHLALHTLHMTELGPTTQLSLTTYTTPGLAFLDLTISNNKFYALTEADTIYLLSVTANNEVTQQSTQSSTLQNTLFISIEDNLMYYCTHNTLLVRSEADHTNYANVSIGVDGTTNTKFLRSCQFGVLLCTYTDTPTSTTYLQWYPTTQPSGGDVSIGEVISVILATNNPKETVTDCVFGSVEVDEVIVYCISKAQNWLKMIVFISQEGTIIKTVTDGDNNLIGPLLNPVKLLYTEEGNVIVVGNDNKNVPYISTFTQTPYQGCSSVGAVAHSTHTISGFGDFSIGTTVTYECTSHRLTHDGLKNIQLVCSLPTNSTTLEWSTNPPVCLDECAGNRHNCHKYATCVPNTHDGSSTCVCDQDYVGNGVMCEWDECATNTHNCTTTQTCEKLQGDYICHCIPGHKFDTDLQTCVDINECTENTSNCDEKYGICTNFEGSFGCGCIEGFVAFEHVCADINECGDGTHNCHRHAQCVNDHGSFRCFCLEGYIGDGVNCDAAGRGVAFSLPVLLGLAALWM